MSQLCSIHHDIPETLHILGAYVQWSVFDHNGDKQSVVFGTRYGIWIGLDLFNDDTRPSGYISRPTQVNVSQELLSFSK